MDNEELTHDEKIELMGVGAIVIEDVKKLINDTSSAIRTDFRHGLTIEKDETEDGVTPSVEILLFFKITDLGGSKKEDIETFIRECVLDIFKAPSMYKFKVQWSFLAEPE